MNRQYKSSPDTVRPSVEAVSDFRTCLLFPASGTAGGSVKAGAPQAHPLFLQTLEDNHLQRAIAEPIMIEFRFRIISWPGVPGQRRSGTSHSDVADIIAHHARAALTLVLQFRTPYYSHVRKYPHGNVRSVIDMQYNSFVRASGSYSSCNRQGIRTSMSVLPKSHIPH